MNFLVDAQLPRRMASWFAASGCDAIHTFDLPLGNRTTDRDILLHAEQSQRILVTKDTGFVDSHLLLGQPAKLLLVTTGNISNRELERLAIPLIPKIINNFQTESFLELGTAGISVRA